MKKFSSVLFFTHWSDHPYLEQLTKSLIEQGVSVKFDKSLSTFPSLLFSPNRPDIIHLHWLHPFFVSSTFHASFLGLIKLLSGIRLAKLLGIKIVWTVHNLKNHESQYLFFDTFSTQFMITHADAILVHCEAAKQELIDHFKLENSFHKTKLFVIPHGNFNEYYDNTTTRSHARKELDLAETDLVLLFLGVIRPYKGISELVDTFETLTAHQTTQTLKLVIAGRVPNETPLDDRLQTQLQTNPNIIFKPGYVPDEDIQLYMNAADAVVFPYRDVLTSGSVILAMSFGKACIAPNIGCVGEVLKHSGALLYEPSNPKGLYEAMHHALMQTTELATMGKHNQQLTEQWNWECIAEMTADVYRKCVIHEFKN